MSLTLQLVVAAVTAGLPTLAVLVSLLINNQRLTDFERRIDQRFGDMDQRFDQRFSDMGQRVDERFADMGQRFTDTNQRIEAAKETLRAEMYRMEQVLDARLRHLEQANRA